ncbi:type II secretion system protein [Luteolibacter sp.]
MMNKPKNDGFTLVELLVVIVIIASLAALALTIGPRMLARGKATVSMENMRQISPLLTMYATDHSMKLPPILGPETKPDGTVQNVQWNEVCLALLYPTTDPADFKNKAWWDKNKAILRNPLLEEGKGWAPLNPGYAMNEMIAENIAAANPDIGAPGDTLAMSVPMSMITDPSHTPLIAPFNDYHYRFDDGQISSFSGPLKVLLSEGKFPILFVDGHIDVMTPTEYKDRQLAKMPLDPSK